MRRPTHNQCGQALAEALVALVPMTALFLLVPVVGGYLDTAAAVQRVATTAAFDFARGATAGPVGASGPVAWHSATAPDIDDASQPGRSHARARRLREEWQLDAGPTRFHANAASMRQVPEDPRYAAVVRRHAVILAGAGHAVDDTDAQQRVAASASAWATPAGRAVQVGRAAAAALQPLDAAWNRPAPDFDWLQPWAGRVPANEAAR